MVLRFFHAIKYYKNDTNSIDRACLHAVRRHMENTNENINESINGSNDLDLVTIMEKIEEYAYTKGGKQEIHVLKKLHRKSELEKSYSEIEQAKQMIIINGKPPFSSFDSLMTILKKAQKTFLLTPEEFADLAIQLVSIKRLKEYLIYSKNLEISLPWYADNMDECTTLYEMINTTIRNHQVDDYASKVLSEIRVRKRICQDKMKEKAENVLKNNKSICSENFITYRNNRICIPVKKEYKNRIAGSVIDESSSKNTVFIEPKSVERYCEELEGLSLKEELEMERILYELTGALLEKEDAIIENNRIIELLDVIFAKAMISIELECTAPILIPGIGVNMLEARHPLIEKNQCVPLSLSLGRDFQGIVITGPNTGGKTVTIKTVGLMVLMANAGLHVPCKYFEMGRIDHVYCDIGDKQNMSQNLSTFSAHLKRLLRILEVTNANSLVLLDELGSGTDPAEGMGIAVAILEELRRRGCLLMVTTHYPQLKDYASLADNLTNARMTFDIETFMPMYQLKIGEAGESQAIAIAKRMGMSEQLLEWARKAAYEKEFPFEQGLMGNKNGQQKGQQSRQFQDDINHKSVIRKKEIMGMFEMGDCVMVYPQKEIGIVVEKPDESGNVIVQVKKTKKTVNYRRLKKHIAKENLYPDEYDFAVVFDRVEVRKGRKKMSKKHVEGYQLELEKSRKSGDFK